MTTMTEHVFTRSVSGGAFEPVYYLFGDDDFRKDEAVAHALAAAVPPGARAFNLEVRRAADLDAESLASLLDTPPMLTARRAVAIRDVGLLRKDARRALDRYLDRAARDTLLLLVATAGGKPDRNLADRAVAVEFPVLTEDRVAKWIVHRASTLDATVTREAVALLQAAVGADLALLAAEIDKLVSYVRGTAPSGASASAEISIDDAAVTAVVGVRRGETLGDFLDRVAAGDAAGGLALIPHILAQPKTTAVSVLLALTTQTLAIAWGVALREQGSPPARLRQEYFEFLKATGNPMTGRPWGEAVEAWARAAERASRASLDRALDALLAADLALKDTRVSTEEQMLATLVLEICAGEDVPHRRAA
jgi:DNA polymerase-3 subunit delta